MKQIKELFQSAKLKDIPRSSREPKEVICIDSTVSIGNALQTLADNHILSAPVYFHGKCVGLLDTLDCLCVLLEKQSSAESAKMLNESAANAYHSFEMTNPMPNSDYVHGHAVNQLHTQSMDSLHTVPSFGSNFSSSEHLPEAQPRSLNASASGRLDFSGFQNPSESQGGSTHPSFQGRFVDMDLSYSNRSGTFPFTPPPFPRSQSQELPPISISEERLESPHKRPNNNTHPAPSGPSPMAMDTDSPAAPSSLSSSLSSSYPKHSPIKAPPPFAGSPPHPNKPLKAPHHPPTKSPTKHAPEPSSGEEEGQTGPNINKMQVDLSHTHPSGGVEEGQKRERRHSGTVQPDHQHTHPPLSSRRRGNSQPIQFNPNPHTVPLSAICVIKRDDDYWLRMAAHLALDLINAADSIDLSHRNPYCPIALPSPEQAQQGQPEPTLLDVANVMRRGIHRVPLTTHDGKIIRIFSASLVVQFLSRHPNRMQQCLSVPVADVLRHQGVVTVHESDSALNAFKVMRSQSVSSVAVVDTAGVLKYILQNSDLKYLTVPTISKLKYPVGKYIRETPAINEQPHSVALDDMALKVLHDMAEYGVHRVYLVDSTGRPKGVLTLKNILDILLSDK
eukprot:GCRY01003288.1.p1 GENE.GCRY01003288.1~~GCRY01003288.1.p1  ORF type:complete len:618 (-),score=174.95 GCRY01003288.1:724-2577(-)